MQTDVAPASVRDRATAICRRNGLGMLSTQGPLDEAGGTVFTDAVVALERAFGICIEMDELWDGMRLADLVALVEAKASDVHRKDLLPANDDNVVWLRPSHPIPDQPAPWLRRLPMVGLPPHAHAVRARRIAFAADRRRFLVRLVLAYPALAGFVGALIFCLAEPR